MLAQIVLFTIATIPAVSYTELVAEEQGGKNVKLTEG
jgi:hypothetical protein